MDLGLEGRGYLVCGGSRGLGFAVASALIAEGANVLLTARNKDALAEAADGLGERASWVAAGLSEPTGVDLLVQRTTEQFEDGLSGVLVNHGGPRTGTALELTDAQWLEAFKQILGGPLRLIRGLVPEFAEGSSLLFVTSSSVRAPLPSLDASNVLRPGVAALAKSLSIELGPRVRVNTIAPGRVDTERVQFLDEERAGAARISYEEQRARMVAMIPLGRYGDPDEFGRTAAFILSPAASYISGAAIQVDGGYVRSLP